MKIGDLWVISNAANLGGIDEDDECYLSESAAVNEANTWNALQMAGRSDWKAYRLSHAIDEAKDDAGAAAAYCD